MVVASQLVAKISSQGYDETKEKMQGISKTVDSTSGGLKSLLQNSLATAAGFAIFNVGANAVSFLKDQLFDSVKIAMDHEQIMDQTTKVLKSTGGAAGMTQQSIEDLASSLQKTTYFSKDATEGGENLLLTFTGIGKDVFPLATKTMLDMSKAMGQDIKSSAIQLGKALNDPKYGLSALTEVGVTFTDQQKQMILQMTAAGDTAGAQKIMLAELQREFGGSADATGTLAGRMTILKDRFNDIKEHVGEKLLPILSSLAGFVLDDILPAFGKAGDAFQYVGNVLKSLNLSSFNEAWKDTTGIVRDIATRLSKDLAPALKLVGTDADPIANIIGNLAHGALQLLSDVLWDVETVLLEVDKALATGKGPFSDFASSLQRIAGLAGGEFNRALKDVGDVVKQVGGWFKRDVVPALKDAEPGFKALGDVILKDVLPALFQIRAIAQDVIEHVIAKFGPLVEKIVPPLIRFAGILARDVGEALKFIMPYALEAAKAIGKFAGELIDRVAPIAEKVFSILSVGLTIFGQLWANAWPMISQILKGAWDIIVGIIQIAWALVTGIIKIGLDIISGNWAQAWTDAKDMLSGIWDGMLNILRGAWEFIKIIFSPVVRWFSDIWQNVVDAFHNILGGLGDLARNIFNGVIGGVKWGINQVIDLVDGVISHINNISGTVGITAIPLIPHLASGTDFFPGGLAMYGEGGEAELVTRPTVGYLPRGTRVTPVSQLSQFGGGSSSSGGQQQPIIVMDGRVVGKLLMSHIVNNARLYAGVRI